MWPGCICCHANNVQTPPASCRTITQKGNGNDIMGQALYRVMRYLPRQLLWYAVRLHVHNKRQRVARAITPSSIIVYVTSKCNLKCSHCFYWDSLNKSIDDMTIPQYRKLARSLARPIALSLTGGEPMLRRDLPDLVHSFTEVGMLKELSMATNGYFTDATGEFCRNFLQGNPGIPLSVQVSLDGMTSTHDNIRGVAGSFNRAIATLESLTKLAGEVPLFSVSAGIAVQKRNAGEMDALLELLGPTGVTIRVNLIRGETSGTFGVSSDNSSHFDPREGSDIALGSDELHTLHALLIAKNSRFGFWSKRHQRIFEIGMRTVETRRKQIDCYAGTMDAVVYADGTVSLCELTKPVGNLKEYDFDLGRMWRSEAVAAMKAKVGTCFCTHGCNLSTSLMFDPEIVMESVEMKLSAIRRGPSA